MKTSLFVGHGNTTVVLSSSSSILTTVLARWACKKMFESGISWHEACQKKKSKQRSDIADESESIANVSSSMDNGGNRSDILTV